MPHSAKHRRGSWRRSRVLAALGAFLLGVLLLTPGGPARAAGCGGNACLLDIQYVTTYQPAGGGPAIVKTVNATVGEYRLLDVTGDGKPDLSASVIPVLGPGPLGNSFVVYLKITRLTHSPATLPVMVELITHDPRDPSGPGRIAYGYDGRTNPAGAPWQFTTTLTIYTTNPLHLSAKINSTPAGPSAALNLVSSVFIPGSEGLRQTSIAAQLGLTPAPRVFTAGLEFTPGGENINVASTTPTRVDGAVQLYSGADVTRLTTTIDKLPTSVAVHVLNSGQVTYDASAPIDVVRATLTSTAPLFGSAKLVDARVTSVPKHFALAFSGGNGAPVVVSSDTVLPRIEAVVDDGADGGLDTPVVAGAQPVDGDNGVYFRSTPTRFFAYVTFAGFKGVQFGGDAGNGTISGGITSGGGHIVDIDSSIVSSTGATPFTVQAAINKLPSSVTFSVGTLGSGHTVTYDASSSIGLITLEMRGLPIDRLNSISARIENLPKHVQALIDPANKTFAVTTNDPKGPAIGYVSFKASRLVASYPKFRSAQGFGRCGQTFGPDGFDDCGLIPSDDVGGFSTTADGFSYYDGPATASTHPDVLSVGLQIHGVRSASAQIPDGGPKSLIVTADVDPALAQPFGVNVSLPLPPDVSIGSPLPEYDAFLSALQPQMSIVVGQGSQDVFGNTLAGQTELPHLIQYDSAGTMNHLDFQTNLNTTQFMRVDLDHLAPRLHICFGTSDGNAAIGCIRGTPRPLNHTPDQYDTTQKAAVNIDDLGTATQDMVMNLLLCTDQYDPDHCNSSTAGKLNSFTPTALQFINSEFVLIQNLHLRNLFADIDGERCPDSLLFCGHISMDTRGQALSGDIVYFKEHAGGVNNEFGTYVDISPSCTTFCFSTNQRFSHWEQTILTAPSHADYTEGTASCPTGMDWPLVIFDQVGTKTVDRNLAYYFLCNNYG